MQCVNCGNKTGSNSKYCSVACKSKYLRKQHKIPQTNTLVEEPDESKHNRKLPELYTRFDGRRVPLTEAELINEGFDWFKSKVIGKEPNPQSNESIRQLTVTDLANLRAQELNGETSQFQSYTPSSFDQQPVQTQPSGQPTSSPQFNAGEAIKSIISKVFPQKKKEFPQRPVNEYGQAMANWKCYSCWDWVPDTQIALHQVEGHIVEHVW